MTTRFAVVKLMPSTPMKDGATTGIETLTTVAAKWTRLWGVPGLEERCTIGWSRRMTRSLGVCYPSKCSVRLAAALREAERSLIEEVLCHEMAHLAARELHGDAIRPHGREWKRLMEAAGYTPRTRLPLPRDLRPRSKATKRRRLIYVHYCPACRRTRITRRTMRRWRCRTCIDAGRDGVLTVMRQQ